METLKNIENNESKVDVCFDALLQTIELAVELAKVPNNSNGKVKSEEKPPIGLIPEFVFEADMEYDRLLQIAEAISRYSATNKPIPNKWTTELKKRIDSYHAMATSRVRI